MTPAIFLSYASQDADAARRICDALRAVGLEVWFDQSELRGGDAWDASIRKQIKECALFVPVISDAIVYATALARGVELLTCDVHFEGLPRVVLFPKS